MKDKPKTSPNKEIEEQMLSRLCKLGIMLIVFCLIAFAYALYIGPPSELDTVEEKQLSSGFTLLSADGRINAFGAATAFLLVGITCIAIAAKRRRR